MKKVDRYTRAGNDGKLIQCPECGEQSRVYHFAWLDLVAKAVQPWLIKENG